jgi:hypothetical protein
MNHLDGAYKRVNRASKHLNDLKQEIKLFRQNKINGISIDYQRIRSPIKRNEFIYIRNARSRPIPVPQEFSILIGEIIYNLRAALDYLVYELACFDSKQEIERTQFPIDNSPERFDTRSCEIKDKGRDKYLRGVSPEHVAAIKRLQPFNGCQWTERLRDISNPDKHRQLTTIDSPIVAGSEISSIEALLADKSVNVKDIFSFEIFFQDDIETPVVETLEQFVFNVIETLDSFKPEFKRG